MAIIKTKDKIIRNLGDEILKYSDALIDLRYNYGVTKDGANKTSRIKFKNNPNQSVIQETLSQQPIVDSNGIEFDGDLNQVVFYSGFVPTLKNVRIHIKYKHTEAGDRWLFLRRFDNDNRIEFAYHNGAFQYWVNSDTFSHQIALTLGQTYWVSIIPTSVISQNRYALYIDSVDVSSSVSGVDLENTKGYMSIGDYVESNYSTNAFAIYNVELYNNQPFVTIQQGQDIAQNFINRTQWVKY
ncbi:MAG: hypothetical protein GY679_04360 [Mycoplasma sp.]|nr:hypothetical protein [Mycoplasma sp.]